MVDWLRDDKVYAYQASGQRDSASDFDLDSANGYAEGIAFGNATFYVVDGAHGGRPKVYAYDASGQRASASDLDLDPANEDATGITFANGRVYLVDEVNDEVYVLNPTAPDLVVESPSVSSSTPATGQSFEFQATVRNRGPGASTATTLRYYRSTDTTISTSDTQVGTDAVSALAVDGASFQTITLTAPSAAGTYYYGACVDLVAEEANTGNNCSTAVVVFSGETYPAYDLAISSATLHWFTVESIGDPISMSVTVANRGPNRSQPAKLRFDKDSDSSPDRDIPALDSGATTTFSRVRVGSAQFGTNTFRACIVEAPPGEENTSNNCASRSVSFYAQ